MAPTAAAAPRPLPRVGEARMVRARRIITGSFVLLGVLLVYFAANQAFNAVFIYEEGLPYWRAAAGVALSLPLAWLTVKTGMMRFGLVSKHSKPQVWSSFALLLALLAVLGIDILSMFIVANWWSVAALVLPRRQAVAVTAVLLLWPGVETLLAPEPDLPFLGLLYLVLGVMGAMLFLGHVLWVWLWDVVGEATAGAAAQAELAVTEERLRFARDMHDLLGHSLSSIAVKSELASRLARADPERAGAEMASVQHLARDALREVRAAVTGYRDVDLAEELAGVESVLNTAGIRCTVTRSGDALDAGRRTLAAWIVREATTNLLRHSTARHCTIALHHDGREVIVEVGNDGSAPPGTPREAAHGNGLTGLRERVGAAGGTLSAGFTAEGGFLVRAVLPAERTFAGEKAPGSEDGKGGSA